jgi:hypothetical protein
MEFLQELDVEDVVKSSSRRQGDTNNDVVDDLVDTARLDLVCRLNRSLYDLKQAPRA